MTSNVTMQKIKDLLGNGLKAEVVATAVGVHPSYISQLMSNEAFANEVAALRVEALSADSARDKGLNTIEEKLINRLGDIVDQGMIFKSQDVLRALAIVNNAKRRGVQNNDAANVPSVVVNLTMPVRVMHGFRKNDNGEVVEVIDSDGNSQTLVTMPASALVSKLAAERRQGIEGDQYEKVRRYLPAGGDRKETA